jgi:hypothetical protein
MKGYKLLFAALVASTLSPLAEANVAHAAHDVKVTTVHIARKIGEGARDAAHGTAHAASAATHGFASKVREGYHATKRAVHRVT